MTHISPALGTAERPAHIAIIGGGASGTLLLHQLAWRGGGQSDVTILLVDPATSPGPGLAHSTMHRGHVLNVPAGRMSGLPEDNEHFVRWANANGHAISGGDFVARGIYGGYLKHLIAHAAMALGSRLRTITARVTDLSMYPGEDAHGALPRRITLDNGHTVFARHVVLALGNFTPANPSGVSREIASHPHYFRDPWTSGERFTDALRSPAGQRGVLVIGTGLSMMDVVMQARTTAPQVQITAISRRGLISQPHRPHHNAPATQPPPPVDYWPHTAKGLLRAIRAYVQTCQKREIDWREAVTALRPVTARLWQAMPLEERQRFLCRLLPYWDTHRHRCAPSIAEAIGEARAKGMLDIRAARLGEITPASDGFEVTLHERGGEPTRLTPGYIINCTGPHMDLAKVGDALIDSLLKQGVIRQDALRIGMEIDKLGRPLDVHGLPHPVLWTIGPLRRAALWETIAIPEIRVQAQELADALLQAYEKIVL